jgi:hypothetical protein
MSALYGGRPKEQKIKDATYITGGSYMPDRQAGSDIGGPLDWRYTKDKKGTILSPNMISGARLRAGTITKESLLNISNLKESSDGKRNQDNNNSSSNINNNNNNNNNDDGNEGNNSDRTISSSTIDSSASSGANFGNKSQLYLPPTVSNTTFSSSNR